MPGVTPKPEDESPLKQKGKLSRALGCLGLGVGVVLIATSVGLLVHFLRPRTAPQVRTEAVGDCLPLAGATQDKCQALGCTWKQPENGGPWCTFPQGVGYKMASGPEDIKLGQRFQLQRTGTGKGVIAESAPIEELTVEIEEISRDTLRIVYRDKAGTRYRVPKEAIDIPVEGPAVKPPNATKLYDVTVVESPQFGIKVTRRSTGAVIFDTSLTGFVFSDQYIQLTTPLPSANLYGFGEHNHRQFKHDMKWRKWTIFTRGIEPVEGWNLYGQQPMYMNLENDANANAVLLLNSNAMDVVLQPDDFPAITYHVTGGVLDFYVFLGPTPEAAVRQYTFATGRPMLPPYWSLGFQLSRWDYHNLSHVEEVVDRNLKAGIPLDVQYGDIDYMEAKLDFTYDKVLYKGLPDFVNQLHEKGIKYIVILDHCIGSNRTVFKRLSGGRYPAFENGTAQDVFIRDPRDPSKYLEGKVWPGLVHYPDFTLGQNVTDWWTDQCDDFYAGPEWGVQYDALWIDMNEPANFVPGSTSGCEKNKWNNPPYVPNVLGAGDDGRLYDRTICMDAKQHWGLHYDVHSLYGHSMTIVTWKTLKRQFPTQRPLVLTRSQFTGSQKYAGHWLGDNQSQWRQIPWSIVGMLEFSLFGFSYIGADVCGFWLAATEELCQRWMQLGAFYPFSRNHNGRTQPDQDPAAYSDEMIAASRDVLTTRYKLLPLLYTLMWDAHTSGSTVVRPLMHEFTGDNVTWSVDRQFLWGPALLISPALEQNQVVVRAYFPETRWYDYYGGLEVENTGSWHNLSTPLNKINLHVRGGHVIPYQQPGNTTVESRKKPAGVIVALGEAPSYSAGGKLVWDDGLTDSGDATYDYTTVNFTCALKSGLYALRIESRSAKGMTTGLSLETTEIWGLPEKPADVRLNDNPVHNDLIDFNSNTKAVTISAKMSLDSSHVLTWRITS